LYYDDAWVVTIRNEVLKLGLNYISNEECISQRLPDVHRQISTYVFLP